MDPEERLTEQARQGSDEAFCQLLLLHQVQVHTYIGRYVRNRDVVSDLAQETFLKAYRSLATYRGESSLRVWFLKIARNEVLLYVRGEERRRSREQKTMRSALEACLGARVESESPDPADRARRLSALEGCMRELPGHSADLIANVYFRGRKTGDIARQTGRPVGSISMAVLRIRQVLRRCIESRLEAKGV